MMVENKQGISDSKFSMWRGVIVMIHADHVITQQELGFIHNGIKDLNLTQEQLDIVADDLKNPKDPQSIFDQITEHTDRKEFFVLARAVAWCDGDFVEQERHIINILSKQYIGDENITMLEDTRHSLNEIELN